MPRETRSAARLAVKPRVRDNSPAAVSSVSFSDHSGFMYATVFQGNKI